jgi:Uma2 family endonuclease
MALKKAKVRFNYDDYCLLPEHKRYEIIDGEIYVVPSPSFAHQDFLLNLAVIMRNHVRENGLGVVVVAPFDVILSEEDIVQPDLVFIAQDRRTIITRRGCEGPSDLAVELHSPSTANRDKDLKRKLYAAHGVREYWLVDPNAGSIEVLALEAGGYRPAGVYQSRGDLDSLVLPGLELEVADVFQPS